MLPTLDLVCEENTARWKWKKIWSVSLLIKRELTNHFIIINRREKMMRKHGRKEAKAVMQPLLQRPPHLAALFSILCVTPDPKKYQQSHHATRPCLLIPAQQILQDRPSTTSSLLSPPPHHVAKHRLVLQRQRPLSPVSYLLSQAALSLDADLAPDEHGIPYIHARTTASRCAPALPRLTGPCSPASPPLGSLLPSFPVSRLPAPQLLHSLSFQ